MDDEFMLTPAAQDKKLHEELIASNTFTQKYGLTLSEQEVQQLILHRRETLKDTGRIELNSGVLSKLIFEFSDSPYIMQDSYEETLEGLEETFYYFKSEFLEMADDELIQIMKKKFNGVCDGDLDYLQESVLAQMSHDYRMEESDD